ncbi:MAG: hypothetical protein FWG11_07955 [Promicromonosporaceae bacterium]|nr:hypothetical protein [Promicromonosporaceae bacterium]
MKTQQTRVLALGLVYLGVVSGCAGDTQAAPPGFDGPWAEVFGQEYERAESDFVRDILRDGVLTTAEVREALHRVQACADLSGFEVEVFTDPSDDQAGAWRGTDWDRPEFWPVMEECHCRYTGLCDWSPVSMELGLVRLYHLISENPHNLSRESRAVTCLQQHGIVPPEFTEADLREVMPPWLDPEQFVAMSPTERVEWTNQRWNCLHCWVAGAEVECRDIPDCEEPPLMLPNGVSLEEGQAALCLGVPAN